MARFVAVVSWLGFFIMVFAATFIPKGYWIGHWHPSFAMVTFFIMAVIASIINADYEVKEGR